MKELQHILKMRALQTYFQPLVELETGKNIGYEVLNRPTLSSSFSSTEEFYDFIGKTDQIFFVEQLSRQLSLERFFQCLKDRPSEKQSLIFINVHPKVLTDSHYKSGETLNLLKKYNVSPSNVVFEITEKSAVDDYRHLESVLSNYRSQGFRIAIDDAGSGYNSLKTIVYLKPEFLKIDKTIIQYIDQDKAKQQFVKLLLEFANKSGTYVIAEGIEREQELRYLIDNGIHIGQGYAIGKPKRQLVNGKLQSSGENLKING